MWADVLRYPLLRRRAQVQARKIHPHLGCRARFRAPPDTFHISPQTFRAGNGELPPRRVTTAPHNIFDAEERVNSTSHVSNGVLPLAGQLSPFNGNPLIPKDRSGLSLQDFLTAAFNLEGIKATCARFLLIASLALFVEPFQEFLKLGLLLWG